MVIGFDLQRREIVLDGKPFGDAGPYEKIVGRLRYAVDPKHPLHRQITDIDRVACDDRGRVTFEGDFYLLRPLDSAGASRTLLFDVPNRGRKSSISLFNSTPRVSDPVSEAHFGNGFLLRQGYTLAWAGWQADIQREPGFMALDVPRAEGLEGYMRVELKPHSLEARMPLGDLSHVTCPSIPQATIDPDDPAATLSVRAHGGADAVAIPRTAWRFPDPTQVELDGGFRPGAIYSVVFRAKDPPGLGLGFLAIRDAAAWLRWGAAEGGNPCAGTLDRAYLYGMSQNGRFIREMLYRGLDEDERGRMVFDGVLSHIAGAQRGEFNVRFGQPSLLSSQSVGALEPFDDVTLYRRLIERGRAPRIITTNSSWEYWRGDASLIHTDIAGRSDVDPPHFARTYLLAGTQHTTGPIPPLEAEPNTGNRGQHPFNVVDDRPLMRSLLRALDLWVTQGTEPPPSAFPRVADGTAVQAESLFERFRRLPGVRPPERIGRPRRMHFGPLEASGAPHYPPTIGDPYPSSVSQVDADANEIAGIRAVELRVPLCTYMGWNPRHVDNGAPGDIMLMMGSSVPFARTRAERERNGDPRRSVEERYTSKTTYLEHVRRAAYELVAQRHLLEEDIEGVIARASQCWDWVQAKGA